MLNIDELKNQLQSAIEKNLGPALEIAYKQTSPEESETMNETALKFGQTVIDLCAEPMAIAMAGAIDYYVRSISISGTVITTGGQFTQTAMINSPSAITNGKIPNTLAIN